MCGTGTAPHGGGDLLSVRSIFSIRTALLGAALALGSTAPALAADPDVYEAPTISGTAQVTKTLTANGGKLDGPSGTTVGRVWLRCTDSTQPRQLLGDHGRGRDDVHARPRRPGQADPRRPVRLPLRRVGLDGVQRDRGGRRGAGGDADPTPTPTPTRTPTPTPTPAKTPTPTPTPTPDADAHAHAGHDTDPDADCSAHARVRSGPGHGSPHGAVSRRRRRPSRTRRWRLRSRSRRRR